MTAGIPGSARIVIDIPRPEEAQDRRGVLTTGLLGDDGELDPEHVVVQQLSWDDERAINLWTATVVRHGGTGGCSPSFFS